MSATPKRKSRPSTAPRRADFPLEYIKDLNATKAAQRCGYSRKTARAQGSRLLTDADIAARIQQLQQERAERSTVTADRILAEVDGLALGHIGEVLDFSGDTVRFKKPKDMNANAVRLLASMKVKRTWQKSGPDDWEPVEVIEFKLWDKTAALRLAMQHRGMLVERVLDIPLEELSDVEVERIRAGEDPLRVLVDSRRR